MERASWVFHQEALIKKGGDLLSHFRSTIGAEGLNFSVRNGKRWNTLAITTYIVFKYPDFYPHTQISLYFMTVGRKFSIHDS